MLGLFFDTAVTMSAPGYSDRDAEVAREPIRGRTEELERLAVEMYARGLSVRATIGELQSGHGHSGEERRCAVVTKKQRVGLGL